MTRIEQLLELQETRGVLTSDDVLEALELTDGDVQAYWTRHAGTPGFEPPELHFALAPQTLATLNFWLSTTNAPHGQLVFELKIRVTDDEYNTIPKYHHYFAGVLAQLAQFTWHVCEKTQTLDYLHDLIDKQKSVWQRLTKQQEDTLRSHMNDAETLRQHVRAATNGKEEDNG